MSDLKIVCPNCSGHISYPRSFSGQATSCPHCQQPVVLGSKSRAILWVALSAICLLLLLGVSALFWNLGRRNASHDPIQQLPIQTTKFVDRKPDSPAAFAPASEDDKEIEALCRVFYEKSNQKDFESMRKLIATPCQPVLTTAVLEGSFREDSTYRFLGVDSIAYFDSAVGKLAKARIHRSVLTTTSESDGVREFKCVKERDGWRLFRDSEWLQKLVADFDRSGLTPKLGAEVRRFCSSDPFSKWPANETNAFEKIYEMISERSQQVFPWHLSLTIETNYVDGWMLKLGFRIRNHSKWTLENGGFDFELKQAGRTGLSSFELLPDIRAGTDGRGDASFFNKNELRESAHFELDVWYDFNGQKHRITTGVPIDFKVQKITESVKVEILGRSFETTKNTAMEDILVARVDYRVRNISKEPVKAVQLKFVWFSLKDELLSQGSEYVIGYGDLPLLPQQTKKGFTHCNVGYSYRRVPVKVDIYLAEGEGYWPLYKGLLVR